MLRRVLIGAIALLILGGGAVVAVTSGAAATTVSPCRQVYSNPVWSPDGTEIAYYGRRWPKPASQGHGNPNSILQAYCTMKPDGTNAQPLRYTVCSENCQDPPSQIAWLQSGLFVLVDGGPLYRIDPGSKPVKVLMMNSPSFTADKAGDRIAAGLWPGCVHCAGPISVYDLATGKRIGTAGGKKLYNVAPSLSPDGSQVVFERDAANDSGKTYGIWRANVDGSGLRQLAKVGRQPLWSPSGGKVAYVAPAGQSTALRLVPAGGGKSRVLVAKNVSIVFGWSPNARYIAFATGTGPFKLAIVNVATGKFRTLLKLQYGPTAAWAPNSQQLVTDSVSPRARKCWWTYRVSTGGAKKLLSTCSG